MLLWTAYNFFLHRLSVSYDNINIVLYSDIFARKEYGSHFMLIYTCLYMYIYFNWLVIVDRSTSYFMDFFIVDLYHVTRSFQDFLGSLLAYWWTSPTNSHEISAACNALKYEYEQWNAHNGEWSIWNGEPHKNHQIKITLARHENTVIDKVG